MEHRKEGRECRHCSRSRWQQLDGASQGNCWIQTETSTPAGRRHGKGAWREQQSRPAHKIHGKGGGGAGSNALVYGPPLRLTGSRALQAIHNTPVRCNAPLAGLALGQTWRLRHTQGRRRGARGRAS
jgi:hypothetical protein